MKTRFFKFPDMETSFALAQAAGLTTKDDHNEDILVRVTHKYALDIIGVIYEPTGVMLENQDGLFYPETAPIPGWHVNVRILDGDLPVEFSQYEVFPTNPSRDFA